MIHEIKFNSQRDNNSFGGLRPASTQCYPTCAYMFMSYFISAIDGADDRGLAEYMNEVEIRIPGGTIAENFYMKNPNFPKALPSSVYWDMQCYAINQYFDRYGVNKTAQWGEVTFEKMKQILNASPVILGTMLTASGHIILLRGFEDGKFYVNDPYGDWRTGYRDVNGAVEYPESLIKLTGETTTKIKDRMRIMYVEAA